MQKKNQNFVETKVAKFSSFFSLTIFFLVGNHLTLEMPKKKKFEIFLKKKLQIFFFSNNFFFRGGVWKSLKTCRNAKK